MRLHTLALSCALVAPGCGSALVTNSPLGAPVVLRVGQVATFPNEGLRIGFSGVPEDSRCPPDAICIWQGLAVVAVWVSRGSAPRQELTLATEDLAGHSRRGRFDGYEIELLRLAPAHSGQLQQSDYEATLVVTGG